MRILITLAAAAALMAGLVIGIVVAASLVTKGAPNGQGILDSGSDSMISKVAFAVLWCLVAGVATGLIGSG